ncbi:MAG: c-type cytochrome [Chloroflexi bacterium]|nr:c-type cytochrome [Chloroflexota bacterium]
MPCRSSHRTHGAAATSELLNLANGKEHLANCAMPGGQQIMKRLMAYIMLHKKLFLLAIPFAGFLAAVPIMLVGGHELVEVVDSPAFCTSCHNVHYAEAVTFEGSPHSEVSCAGCHVGTGAYNLVRSKIRGLNDILPTITGNYERPIPTPLKDRRPSSQTCEKCHAAEKFFGDMPRIRTAYDTDESNTKKITTQVLRVGGGREEVANGIHWHSAGKVWYLAVDDKLLDIAWVAVDDGGGNVTEYVNPNKIREITPERFRSKVRLMDCMDCHNRVTHLFRSPDELVDKALSDGSIDAAIPFIKREALDALVPQNASLQEAYARTEQIREFYRANFPRVVETKGAAIDSAIGKLKEVARLTTFPDGLDWNTYPDHATHEPPGADMQMDFDDVSIRRNSPGCFRCHGTLVRLDELNAVSDAPTVTRAFQPLGAGAPAGGQAASNQAVANAPEAVAIRPITAWPAESRLTGECNSCHYALQPGASPLAPATSHPVDRLDNCLSCHSPASARPFKTDHPWSTNAACGSCHQSAPRLERISLSRLPEEAKPIPHSTSKLETCLSCHNPRGANPFSNDHPWSTDDTCAACHQASANLKPLPASNPPVEANPVPHPTNKLESCLTCHQPSGTSAFSKDHPWSTEETCSACHQPARNPKPLPTARPPAEARALPHATSRLETCLSCHLPSGASPISRDHPWSTDETCSACHKPSTNPKPLPAARPPDEAGSIPHSTNKLENCLSCHQPSGVSPFSKGHPWSTNDTCSACHKPAAAPLPVTAPAVPSASEIRHSTTGLSRCLSCHSQSGPAPFRADHTGRPESLCTICHKPGGSPQPQSAIAQGSPVPHPASGLGSCLSCHGQGGPIPFPGNHAGRPESLCLICHKPGGAAPPPPPVVIPTSPPPAATPTPPPAVIPTVTPAPPTPTPAPPTPTPAPPSGINAAVLYAANCAMCHGANRQGGIASALTTTALAGKTVNQIIAATANGVPPMPGYSSILTQAQISALAQYLKTTPP